jgi:hypothetical protein
MHIVTRDQFRVLPTPDLVASHLTSLAEAEGYVRGMDPTVGDLEEDLRPPAVPLPTMLRFDENVPLQQSVPVAPDVGVENVDHSAENVDHSADQAATRSAAVAEADAVTVVPIEPEVGNVRRSVIRGGTTDSLQSLASLPRVLSNIDKDFVFKISVRAALRDRETEARPVMMAELQQIVDKRVWHGVKTRNLTRQQRRAIIRSSMFLKDKYLASNVFDKLKARLVAGGDQQDKSLYETLSSPTVTTPTVLTVAALAAMERREVIVLDIGGAFLNASMEPTGIVVHMRLDRVLTAMLLEIDESYREFLEPDGTLVVALDKALYGCVEASMLWYNDLCAKLLAYGFEKNPYDNCSFNKVGTSGDQITTTLHVDDLMVTSVHQRDLDMFVEYLRSVYKEVKVNTGKVLNYLGMTFDYREDGQVRVTMESCVNDILAGCGVETTRASPAASTLFDVRDAPKATAVESKWFHTYVMKMLYLSKRVKPECLTSVFFLTTRVQCCDIDDIAKLKRLLGYLRGSRERGIVLRVGDDLQVKTYIDASYGVHQDSGKSHTGCVIVIGAAGPVYAKSGKQKIVTKSSMEAEMVGMSDSASASIHMRHWLVAQGYDMGPVVVYQDNMSCMALIKRGGPASERSRHISIRYFWLKEKVADGTVVIEHLGTAAMFANLLTKPLQGAQFIAERQALTNWD